ncbi:DMT family transporter [Desulfosediminicola flagellatus]|uniref:DMT family transporter n=1 Tax=Desulfosediminicola flagellatus TaxID=2569541 RepID=UPI0010AC1BDE|nr:DMT family transporter [Desulfosediminicola flagellatus]
MPFLGEVIAVTTVLCWTVSVQFFGAASKAVGSTSVNIIRIFVALILFSVFLFIRDGVVLPLHFPAKAWIYLSLSGIVGFFIGDIFLFKALVELGPRVAMLMHSLAAPTAAVIGWLFLSEMYSMHQWLGIIVTLAGVGIVILERDNRKARKAKREVSQISLKGIGYGIGAMAGQAGGFVLSKVGMQSGGVYLDAFSATQIRAVAAFICFVLFFTCTHKWRNVRAAIGNTRAVTYTVVGAFIGPFIGVSLSLMTLHYLTTGVASTILSLVPICIIPFSIFLHNEHVSLRAICGAVIAIFGVYLLVA